MIGSSRQGRKVWEVVNKEKKKRRKINEGIELEEWVRYFKRLLGRVKSRMVRGTREVKREGDSEPEISRAKVVRAIERLKEDKTVGRDEIPEEVWKFRGERKVSFIWEVCNRV